MAVADREVNNELVLELLVVMGGHVWVGLEEQQEFNCDAHDVIMLISTIP